MTAIKHYHKRKQGALTFFNQFIKLLVLVIQYLLGGTIIKYKFYSSFILV